MMKKMFKKLKAQTGETLAEILIAMLISTIGLLMLATMINTSANSIDKTRKSMEAYYSSQESTGTETTTINVKFTYSEKTEESSEEKTKTYEYSAKPDSKNLGGKTVLAYSGATKGGTT